VEVLDELSTIHQMQRITIIITTTVIIVFEAFDM